MIVSANGILLENKELPCSEIPFVKFDDVLIGGKFYSDAIITHLRPIQDAYNTVVRMRTEWVKKLLTGKMIGARGSQLAQESLNDQSGEVVYYTPVPNAADGGRPTPLTMPVIPQYAYTEQAQLDAMFNEISGISEVSKGNLPSATIPAIGMQLLVEQDDTRIGVVTEKSEHGWARVGELILKQIKENYVLPRKIKIAGDSGYIVKEIEGSQVKTTDIKVRRGSTMPSSKVLKRQEILNAFQQGLLGDPQDPETRAKVLSWLEFGDVNGIWLDQSLDTAQIKRGIELIEKGEIPPANEFDNHKLWISELNRYRKGEKYEGLPDDLQKLVTTVMETHLQFILKLTGAVQDDPSPQMNSNAMQQADQQTKTAGDHLAQSLDNRAANMPGNQPATAGPPQGR